MGPRGPAPGERTGPGGVGERRELVTGPPGGARPEGLTPRGPQREPGGRREEERRPRGPGGPGVPPGVEEGAFGLVSDVAGQPQIRRKGAADWWAAGEGDALRPGDTVRTGARATLLARFLEGSEIELAPDTEVALGSAAAGAKRPGRVRLTTGDVMVAIQAAGTFEVETPAAVATVKGTRFALRASQASTVLTVLEGQVAFSNEHGAVVVQAQQRSVATTDSGPTGPYRAAGAPEGNVWTSGPGLALYRGAGLYVDARPHTLDEVRSVYERLRTSPETPQLLDEALAPLWWAGKGAYLTGSALQGERWVGGSVRLSLTCARELAATPTRLLDLRRAELGTVHPVSRLPDAEGALVFEVLPGSPAEQAGLQEDDVIVSLSRRPVHDEIQLMDEFWRAGPNGEVEVGFLRAGQPQAVTVAAGAAEPTPQELALVAAFRLLARDRNHVDAQVVVANAQACLGQREQAGAAYERMRSADPLNPVAVNNLGFLAELDRRWAEALLSYETATRWAPDFDGAWANIWGLYRRANMVDESQELRFPLLMAHDGIGEESKWDSRWWLHWDGIVGPRQPDFAQAEDRETIYRMLRENAAKAISFDYATAASAGGLRGLLNAEDGPALGAKGIKLDPANTLGFTGYLQLFQGQYYNGVGNYVGALDCYRRAAALEPEWALPWLRIGRTSTIMGEPADAIRTAYEKAVEIGAAYGGSNTENVCVALEAATVLAQLAEGQGQPQLTQRYAQAVEQLVAQQEAIFAAAEPWALPRNEGLYQMMGRHYVETRNWEGLGQLLEWVRVPSCLPDGWAFLHDLVAPLLKAGEKAQAARVLRLILETPLREDRLPQRSVPALTAAALEMGDAAEPDNAEQILTDLRAALRRVEALRGGDASFLRVGIAQVLLVCGRPQGALVQLEAASGGLAGDTTASTTTRERVLEALGASAEPSDVAARLLTEASGFDEECRQAVRLLARTRPEAGIGPLQAKLGTDWPQAWAQWGLAVLLEAAARTDEALAAARETVAETGPDTEEPYRVLVEVGELLLRHGCAEEASKAFQRALEQPAVRGAWLNRAQGGAQAASAQLKQPLSPEAPPSPAPAEEAGAPAAAEAGNVEEEGGRGESAGS